MGCKAKEGSRGPEEAAPPQAAVGNILRRNINGEPKTLNPLTSKDLYATYIQDYIFETLLDRDYDTLEWKPLLADKWDVSPDGKIITFHIDPRARFSDGTPVTADDVVFTYKTMVNPQIDAQASASFFEDCQDCVKIDDRTVRFTWKKTYFLSLEVSNVMVLPKHAYEFKDPKEFNDLTDKLVGSGPYKFKEWKTGQHIILERNENYWLGRPAFDEVQYRIILGEQAGVQALKAGELDELPITSEWYVKLKDDPEILSRFHLLRYSTSASGYAFIGWNNARPPFDDKRVRQAMTMLVWREQLREYLLFGLNQLTTGPFWPNSNQYDKTVPMLPYDRRAALALLKEAGWEDRNGDGWLENEKGQRFAFEFSWPSGNQQTRDLVRILREEFRRAGIDMSERGYTWAVFDIKMNTHDFDALTLSWGGGGVEADPYQIWDSASIANQGSNFISFRNAEADRLIETARATIDAKKRTEIFHQFDWLIHEEQPYTFLWSRDTLRLVSKRVQGVKVHRLGVDWREWSIDTGPAREAGAP
jgi:peptide/nickel transport system substrate-binding protein